MGGYPCNCRTVASMLLALLLLSRARLVLMEDDWEVAP